MIHGMQGARELDLQTKLHGLRMQQGAPPHVLTVVQKVEQPFALRGAVQASPKEQENAIAIGGVRSPISALARLPPCTLGKDVRHGIVSYFRDHSDATHDILGGHWEAQGVV